MGQPFNASLIAPRISSTVTVPSPLLSHGGQLSDVPRAMLTHASTSSTVTIPSPLQSAAHGVGVAVGSMGIVAVAGGGMLVTVVVKTSDAAYAGESVVSLDEIWKFPNCMPGTTICHDGWLWMVGMVPNNAESPG